MLILLMKCPESMMKDEVCPMWVCRRVARCLANSYVGELMALTMGLSGIESLWILGSPLYSLSGRASVLQIC